MALSLLGVAAMGVPGAAQAQVLQSGVEAVTPPASAETVPESDTGTVPRRTWSIVPRISVVETVTDNVAPFTGVQRSDQVTELAPGVRIDSDSARLKLYLDYQTRQLFYAQNSGRQNTQNYLNSFGTFEAVENWLFVDASGIITQQEISPFGFQAPSNTNINPNRVETSRFQVSPYIRGKMGSYADYEVRYNRSSTQSNSDLVADVDNEQWSAQIKGGTPLTALGWAVDASHQNIDYSGGRKNEADRFRALGSYMVVPEFRVSLSAGQETNNFMSADKTTHTTHGYGFEWLPTERTRVSAFKERRFFGNGHTISIDHRTPLTVLRYSDSRDVSILPGRLSTVGMGSIHDLIFAQMASAIPDERERAQAVDRLLQQYGISPDTVVTRGFFTSRVSLLRRQELSFAIQGTRNVLTFQAVRSEHEALGASTGPGDIFDISRNIRQRGFSVSLAHRLTPLTTLNVVAAQQNTSGSAGNNVSNELRSLHVNVSTKLGPNTTASLGARRSLFDGTNLSYSENAIIGAISSHF